MNEDHKEMPEKLMKSHSYIVLCKDSEGSYLFANGEGDVLADLAGMMFIEHPELFQLMMERHQPSKAERVNMIMEFLAHAARHDKVEAAVEMLSQIADSEEEGDIDLMGLLEKFKEKHSPASPEEDAPDAAEQGQHTMDDMNDFLAEIGLDMKKNGGKNDRD